MTCWLPGLVLLLLVAGQAQAQDHAAGHGQGAPTVDAHAGHDMGGHGMGPGASGPPDVPTSVDDPGRPRRPPPPRAALAGPAHAADALWGQDQMARAREGLLRENGDMRTTAVIIDRLELRSADSETHLLWDVGGWSGGDINRFWWKAEGEGDFDSGALEGEVQALFSRAVSPFWDLQGGLRQDLIEDGDDLTHLVLGAQGLAPYWWEVDAAVFLSSKGDLTARVEAEYDQRLTQRLILQPRIEVEASASNIPERGLGAGLTHLEAGLRLRYELAKEFAPYVGVDWSRDLGATADLTRARGGDLTHTVFVIGLRAWF
ncbi:MAG: copper resistance protein B [Phenylobacterium sp.]|uniref:copper resistance protein B n=1 Tax=Phenylobacterium sp. TaxID=1871053 RepID=UPI0025F2DA07|nr:copper resistance protein B [Phenylobacterium sp.]MCG9917409.1 copper resistance protein B [Phenylobacterium sp.]